MPLPIEAGTRLCLAVVLLSLPTGGWCAAAPAAECTAEWELVAKGVGIGVANDRLGPGPEGSQRVYSEFRPNGLLALFGVDPATREILLDPAGQALRRTEQRQGGRPETNRWQRQADGSWERSLDGKADKTQPPAEGVVIDSTLFPYLLHLGVVAASPSARPVSVIGKGRIYPATLTVTAAVAGAEAYQVAYDSPDGHGKAWMAADLHPLRVEFSDEHGSFRGELRSWRCR